MTVRGVLRPPSTAEMRRRRRNLCWAQGEARATGAATAPEAEVFAGTVNLTGALEVRVTRAGPDTTLGQVKELILAAESSRTPVARTIDRYVAWYLPVVLMLSLIIFFFSVITITNFIHERHICDQKNEVIQQADVAENPRRHPTAGELAEMLGEGVL